MYSHPIDRRPPTIHEECRLEASRELERAVREAVDPSVPVRHEWCCVNERWEVDVEVGDRRFAVWSVEEALERTKEL